MNENMKEPRGYGFAVGLVTGTLVGAGLAMWFAPRVASELRRRVSGSAKNLGKQAADQYEDAAVRVGEAVNEITRKGQEIRDDLADKIAHGAHEVARGAHEVERFAKAAKTSTPRSA